jgi:hypothetical protein
MNSRLNLVFVVAALVFAVPARAQFGMPKAPAAPAAPAAGTGGATAADIDQFVKSATEADTLVQSSGMALLKAVASKEAVEKINAEIAAAKKIEDPKEREAKLAQAQKSMFAALNGVKWEEQKTALAKSKDAEKTANVKSGIWNLALGSLKNVELIAVGKKITSGAPSPTVAAKIPEAAKALEKLVSQADGLTKVVGGAKSLMTTVGLEALPTKASDAAQPLKGGDV